MNITQIKYADREHTQVRITYDDGRVTVGDKQQLINREYISETDVIEPYMTEDEKIDHAKKESLSTINSKRKKAEQEGVVVNGKRYAGDQSNRQTLDEAIRFAESNEMDTFASWKDSDNNYHLNHPLVDVKNALNNIALKRGNLISQEGIAVNEVMTATTVADIELVAESFLEV